jgi:hypothetical protein
MASEKRGEVYGVSKRENENSPQRNDRRHQKKISGFFTETL